jgi:hypothetical protein
MSAARRLALNRVLLQIKLEASDNLTLDGGYWFLKKPAAVLSPFACAAISPVSFITQ